MGLPTLTKVIRRDDKICVNHKKIWRLMREMGVYTIYPKPNLSKCYHAQYVRPYLLRKLNICRPDQVWGVDIFQDKLQKANEDATTKIQVLYERMEQTRMEYTQQIEQMKKPK